MARKRMIDPCLWASEDFSKLSLLAKMVWIGLISNADDEGRGRAKASYLRSILFPYADDESRVADIFPYENEITVKKVDNALNEIAAKMSIVFYKIDGSEYYQLTKWRRFQSIEKPQSSKIPSRNDQSTILRGVVGEQSGNSQQPVAPNRKEDKGSKDNITLSPNGDPESNGADELLQPAEFKKAVATVSQETIEEYFNVIYKIYPRKLGKVQGLTTFTKKLAGLDCEVARTKANAIYSALTLRICNDWQPRLDKDEDEIKFIPYISTWLNQECDNAPKKRGAK